jgi:pentatricopeptide repeat protein
MSVVSQSLATVSSMFSALHGEDQVQLQQMGFAPQKAVAESSVIAHDAVVEALLTVVGFAVVSTAVFWMRQRGRRNLGTRAAAAKSSKFVEAIAQPRGRCHVADAKDIQTRLYSDGDALAAAVRSGQAKDLPRMLTLARTRAAARSADPAAIQKLATQHLLSSLRACAAGRYFREALAAYDHEAAFIGTGCNTVWSLLLYSAVEAREFGRCDFFLSELCKTGVPSGNDFVNVVRFHVCTNDFARLRVTLARLRTQGFNLDVVSRNRALSACTSMRAFAFAHMIANEKETGVAMDVVGFNTLIKGFAQERNTNQCAKLYAEMLESGVEPSEVTFGIMLDAFITSRELDRAKSIFNDLRNSCIHINVVHFTVFMKGLAVAGYLDDATCILDEMIRSSNSKPDLVTYSTLVKAQADHGNVQDATRVLGRMIDQGIRPDAISFNIVLAGCTVKRLEASTIFQTLDWLIQNGLQPSTSTLSVVIKALAKSNSWDAAFNFLETASEKLGVLPENRLYAQLAHACATANSAPQVLRAYVALLRSAGRRGFSIDQHTNGRLSRLANSLGFGELVSQLSSTIGQDDGMVKLEELDEVLARNKLH